jgi:hypothetical protein
MTEPPVAVRPALLSSHLAGVNSVSLQVLPRDQLLSGLAPAVPSWALQRCDPHSGHLQSSNVRACRASQVNACSRVPIAYLVVGTLLRRQAEATFHHNPTSLLRCLGGFSRATEMRHSHARWRDECAQGKMSQQLIKQYTNRRF